MGGGGGLEPIRELGDQPPPSSKSGYGWDQFWDLAIYVPIFGHGAQGRSQDFTRENPLGKRSEDGPHLGKFLRCAERPAKIVENFSNIMLIPQPIFLKIWNTPPCTYYVWMWNLKIYSLFDQGSFFSSMTIVSSEYMTLPDNGGYCVRTKDSDGNPFGYKVSFVNIVY